VNTLFDWASIIGLCGTACIIGAYAYLTLAKATNPFLRCGSRELRGTLRAQFPDLPMDDVHVFAKTRELKDHY